MRCEKVELSYPKYLGCFVLYIYKLSFYEDATHRCGESRTRRDSMPINWNKSTKEKKTESTTTCWSVRFCERKIKYFSIFIGLGFLLSFTRERFQKKKITAGNDSRLIKFLGSFTSDFLFFCSGSIFEQQAIDLSRDNCADFDTTRGICLLVTQQKKKSREKHTKILSRSHFWVSEAIPWNWNCRRVFLFSLKFLPLFTPHRRDERRLSPHMHITVVASRRRERADTSWWWWERIIIIIVMKEMRENYSSLACVWMSRKGEIWRYSAAKIKSFFPLLAHRPNELS